MSKEDLMTPEDIERLRKAKAEIGDRIKGNDTVIDGLFIALFTRGHVLLEANPGLGKTSLMKAFTDALGLSFEDRGRIQFTPDLMPADITGTLMPVENDVTKLAFQAGPIFRSILLADEINRATPKTQSAMLEAMAEKQVTVLGKTRRLPLGDRGDDPRAPFMVIATQNPIDQEGTYELPEAQTDRFMFKFLMNMPPANSLREIVERETGQSVAGATNGPRGVDVRTPDREGSLDWLSRLSATVRETRLWPAALRHISNVVLATNGRFAECEEVPANDLTALRQFVADYLDFPLGPRAAIQLGAAAKGYATINATPDDVSRIDQRIPAGMDWAAVPVLRHRLKLKYGWLEKAREANRLPEVEAETVREHLVHKLFRLAMPRGSAGDGYAQILDGFATARGQP